MLKKCCSFSSSFSIWGPFWGHDYMYSFWSHMAIFVEASQVTPVVKNLPANPGDMKTRLWCLGQEHSLEEEMVTHSGILAWRIPWTGEPVHRVTKSQTWLKQLSTCTWLSLRLFDNFQILWFLPFLRWPFFNLHLPYCEQKRHRSIFSFMTFKIIFVLFLSTNNYQVLPSRKPDMKNKTISSVENYRKYGEVPLPFFSFLLYQP